MAKPLPANVADPARLPTTQSTLVPSWLAWVIVSTSPVRPGGAAGGGAGLAAAGAAPTARIAIASMDAVAATTARNAL